MPTVAAVVLAAGHGKRMRSQTAKVLHPVAGRTMAAWVLSAVAGAGIEGVHVVIGFQAEAVRASLGEGPHYVYQAEQLGTGHAVLMAGPAIADRYEHTVVIMGDSVLLEADTLRSLVEGHVQSGASATLVSALAAAPGRYGRIIRAEGGRFFKTVEARDATPEELAVTEVVSGVFAFRTAELFPALKRLSPANAQGEYYLTDVPNLLVRDGRPVRVETAADPRMVLGPNDRAELAEAERTLRQRINRGLMVSGVTITDPQVTYIDYGVSIAPDTVIQPFTHVEGNCTIGSGCVIGPYTRLRDVVVRPGARVEFSVLEDSEVGENATVGPFARLRPGTRLGKGVRIGNFVEVKQSDIGDGVKASHLSYIGDATVGPGTNLGAGTVVVNYDGRRKHRTHIGAKVMVGCNANLVAPVTIGDEAYIAAGSTITEDVPPDTLAIARSRQVNKADWAKKGP